MKRRTALTFVTVVALALCSLIITEVALGNNAEPRILEPMVKTQNCATVFWVLNFGSETTQVTIRFKNEVNQELLRLTLELGAGEKRQINLTDLFMLPTPYVGWAEITADQPIDARIVEPKCKTSETTLHYVTKEYGSRVCTSVIEVTVEPDQGKHTSVWLYFYADEERAICALYYEGVSGSWEVNLEEIDKLPSGYIGYVYIVAAKGWSVEAEVIAVDCEITETPTTTPTPRMTPTMTPTATTTPPRYTIYLPLILKNYPWGW